MDYAEALRRQVFDEVKFGFGRAHAKLGCTMRELERRIFRICSIDAFGGLVKRYFYFL